MHMPGIWGLLVIVVLLFILFGRPGRLSGMMEDLGKGIRGFRKGLSETDAAPTATNEPPRQVPDQRDQAPANNDRTGS
jgi:sec-independent protein translocase protein TatA